METDVLLYCEKRCTTVVLWGLDLPENSRKGLISSEANIGAWRIWKYELCKSCISCDRGAGEEKIVANTYNPECGCSAGDEVLYESIKADGYTMPIVCYYSKEKDVYIIVDGFHRYRVMLEHQDIYDREKGMMPDR